MDEATKESEVRTERSVMEDLIRHAVNGETSLFKENLDVLLRSKTGRLKSKERHRMANIMFSESYIAHPALALKESGSSSEVLYDKLNVVNTELFERERNHMPEWMQEATPEGIDIEPVHEKDAIELSSKFHSVQFKSE